MSLNVVGRVAPFAALFLVAAVAAWTRFHAVATLPPDYDELIYLPVAYDYRHDLALSNYAAIANQDKNREHPPGVKLAYAFALPDEPRVPPDWNAVLVGRPAPAEARPAFEGPRTLSAIFGVLQAAALALVSPVAGGLLALDTYQIKYSAQAYLDGIPGLWMILAVLLFERALRREQPLDWKLLATSAAALGLAASGKYLYALPGFVIVAFLLAHTRSVRTVAIYSAAALAVFFATHPYLWPNPIERLCDSVTYHWAYAHGKHVTESALPWWYQMKYLVTAAPAEWHRGVFATSLADRLMLPLAALGFVETWRRRPVWAAWAAFGIVFLLLWPTKWPQYTLLVRPPLYVCAAFGLALIGGFVLRAVKNRTRA
jgi:hypothetical protein